MKNYPVLFKNKNMICYDKGLSNDFKITHYKDRKEVISVLCKLSKYPNIYFNVTIYEGKSAYHTKRYGFISKTLIKDNKGKWKTFETESSLINDYDYWKQRGINAMIEGFIQSELETLKELKKI